MILRGRMIRTPTHRPRGSVVSVYLHQQTAEARSALHSIQIQLALIHSGCLAASGSVLSYYVEDGEFTLLNRFLVREVALVDTGML